MKGMEGRLNTLAALVALDGVTAVGMARLIGDGGIREQDIRVENAHPGRVR